MSQTYFGRVAVRGMSGTIAFNGTGTVTISDTDMVSRSANVTDEMDTVELPSKLGEVVGVVAFNRRKRCTVEWVPTAPSAGAQTEALAKAQGVFPRFTPSTTAPNYQVTLTGFSTDIDGVYNYLGGASIGQTSEGFTSYTMPLVQYAVGVLTAGT